MLRAVSIVFFLILLGCTTSPAPRSTEATSATASISTTEVPSARIEATASAPSVTSAPIQPSEPADAGITLPDCKGEELRGEIELPPEDALPLNNAAMDASVDRGYPELASSLRRLLPSLRCCYTKASQVTQGLTGRLVIELGLSPDGKVKSVSQAQGKFDINDPMLGSCVMATLKDANFPASRRGQATLMALPLVFRPNRSR